MMKVDIYQGVRQQAKFIAVKEGQDVTDKEVVAITDPDFKNIKLFKSGVLLSTGIAGVDPEAAEKDIKLKNYHIFGSHIEVSVRIVK